MIKLPLTLAIISVLIVNIRQNIFAIPLVAVEEAIRITPQHIRTIKSQPVISWREHTVSLFDLSELFDNYFSELRVHSDSEAANQEPIYWYIVILTDGYRRIGVLVDGLIGEDDIVLKPLTGEQTTVSGIAGAYIRGDGEVSLVIDAATLINLAERGEQRTRRIPGVSAPRTHALTAPRPRVGFQSAERTANPSEW